MHRTQPFPPIKRCKLSGLIRFFSKKERKKTLRESGTLISNEEVETVGERMRLLAKKKELRKGPFFCSQTSKKVEI